MEASTTQVLCGAVGVRGKCVRRHIALRPVSHHVIKAGIGCTTVMPRQGEYSPHSLTTIDRISFRLRYLLDIITLIPALTPVRCENRIYCSHHRGIMKCLDGQSRVCPCSGTSVQWCYARARRT